MVDIYQKNNERNEDWIETFTGRQFWPLDPRAEDVCIEDIAHALSLLCRFNGHCNCFYSVAEHSLLCSELALKQGLGRRMELLALLHDAAEAYISDVSRPVKPYVHNFNEIEDQVQQVIFGAFSIAEPSEDEKQLIEEIDVKVLAAEASTLMPFNNWGLPYPPTNQVTINALKPDDAKDSFLTRFQILQSIEL
ncbi:MAG: phosphohydrolase [Firmicutes bacterium]|nr:phosphohydrolase [Bacillota bacterium]